MNIEIENHELIQKTIVNSVNIAIQSLNFNQSATFRVKFNVNSLTNGAPVFITVDGEEYLGWNNDDDYIIDLILEKLELTRKGSVNNTDGTTTVTVNTDGSTLIQ